MILLVINCSSVDQILWLLSMRSYDFELSAMKKKVSLGRHIHDAVSHSQLQSETTFDISCFEASGTVNQLRRLLPCQTFTCKILNQNMLESFFNLL